MTNVAVVCLTKVVPCNSQSDKKSFMKHHFSDMHVFHRIIPSFETLHMLLITKGFIHLNVSANCVGFILIKDSDTRVSFHGNPSLELDDMVRFKTQDCDFSKVWLGVKRLLEPLGLQMLEHDPGCKFRIAPLQPVAFSIAQHRRHEARLQNPGAARPELMQKAGAARKLHEVPQNPTGINCIDVEVHTVCAASGAMNQQKNIVFRGTDKKIALSPSSIFPIVEGIFGPLRVPVPSTTDLLDAEYGKDWRTNRRMKAIAKNCSSSMHTVSDRARSSAWPSVELQGCQSLLG